MIYEFVQIGFQFVHTDALYKDSIWNLYYSRIAANAPNKKRTYLKTHTCLSRHSIRKRARSMRGI